jgi:hypothetical protein
MRSLLPESLVNAAESVQIPERVQKYPFAGICQRGLGRPENSRSLDEERPHQDGYEPCLYASLVYSRSHGVKVSQHIYAGDVLPDPDGEPQRQL